MVFDPSLAARLTRGLMIVTGTFLNQARSGNRGWWHDPKKDKLLEAGASTGGEIG